MPRTITARKYAVSVEERGRLAFSLDSANDAVGYFKAIFPDLDELLHGKLDVHEITVYTIDRNGVGRTIRLYQEAV